MANESPTKILFESAPSTPSGSEIKAFPKPQSPRHTKSAWLRQNSSNSITLSRLSGTESPTSPRQPPQLSRLNSGDFQDRLSLEKAPTSDSDLEHENKDLKQALEKLLHTNDVLKELARTAREDLAELQERYAEREQELEEERVANKQLNDFHGRTMDENEEELNAAESKRAELEKELEAAKNETKRHLLEKHQQAKAIENLEKKLAVAHADHEALLTNNEAKVQIIQELKAESQTKIVEDGEQEKEIHRLNDLIQQKDAQLKALNHEFIAKYQAAEESLVRCQQLEQDLQVEVQQNHALTEQAHEQSEEVRITHGHLEELQKRLEESSKGNPQSSNRHENVCLGKSTVHVVLDAPTVLAAKLSVPSVSSSLGMTGAITILDEEPEIPVPSFQPSREPSREPSRPRWELSRTIGTDTDHARLFCPPHTPVHASTLPNLLTSLLALFFLFLAWAIYLAEFVDRTPTGAFGFGGSNADNWATRTKATIALRIMRSFGLSRSIYFGAWR